MQCKHCGTQIPQGGKFCTGCGAKVEAQQRFCSGCGAQLPEGSKFCTRCGTPAAAPVRQSTQSAQKNVQPQQKPKRKNKALLIILIVALSVVIVVGTVLAVVLASGMGGEARWQEQYDLGVRYLSEGKYEEAVIAFCAAIDIDPNRPEAYLGAANAYVALGDIDAAKRILEEGSQNTGTDLTDSVQMPAQREEPITVNVTDAYSDVYMMEIDRTLHCFHIPQIELPDDRAAEVNRQIYAQQYGTLEEYVYLASEWEMMDGLTTMAYTWGQKGSAVSVLIREGYYLNDWQKYQVYTVSAQTGSLLSKEQLLEEYGMSMDDYMDQIVSAVERYYDSENLSFLFDGTYATMAEYRDMTLALDNMEAARPYIATNGDLCVVLECFLPAGSGSTYSLLNLTGTQEPPIPQCGINHQGASTGDHPADVSGEWYYYYDLDGYTVVSTLILEADGSVRCGLGFVQSEYASWYTGTWACVDYGDGAYELQLDLQGGLTGEVGDPLPETPHSALLYVYPDQGTLYVDQVSGDALEISLAVDYTYGLDPNTWWAQNH